MTDGRKARRVEESVAATQRSAQRFSAIHVHIAPLRHPSRATHNSSTRHPALTALIAAAALLLLALGAPIPVAASGTAHFMSTTGNDAWTGTGSHPWRTLYASLRKLHPGDTLYIRGGTYGFSGVNWTSLAGTSTHHITITAYRTERPVFVGSGAPADWLYFDGNAAYLTFHGITVEGGGPVSTTLGSSLIGFTGNANHIVLDHMRLYGSGSWGLDQHLVYVAANTVHSLTIRYSVFDGGGCICSGLLSFYHDPNVRTITVTHNTFRNADQAILLWAAAAGVRITYNTFSHTRIAIRHHNSLGTTVAYNRGTSVSIGVYADSRLHLSVSGNSW